MNTQPFLDKLTFTMSEIRRFCYSILVQSTETLGWIPLRSRWSKTLSLSLAQQCLWGSDGSSGNLFGEIAKTATHKHTHRLCPQRADDTYNICIYSHADIRKALQTWSDGRFAFLRLYPSTALMAFSLFSLLLLECCRTFHNTAENTIRLGWGLGENMTNPALQQLASLYCIP